MNTLKRLSKVFESSQQISFSDSSRFAIMSDCHRGDGSWADNFLKNQNAYFAALTHYYNENYTYIELGDGDELWENKKLADIIRVHSDVFTLLSKFYCEGRAYFIFGNHNMARTNSAFIKSKDCKNFNKHEKKCIPLFENVKFHEGLVLRHTDTGDKIFLLHGHQVDFINDRLWRLSRFLVKYLWKPLELFGVNDPTSAARNFKKKALVEKKLIEWIKKENQMLIAGHTHRPMLPEAGEPPYFNDGSCVHPYYITGIEIADGNIVLVRWGAKTRGDGTLYIGREVLAGPKKLQGYFVQG